MAWAEVYRARDTRLDRDVAIKILPEAFTAHTDRVARFEREARVLAALNHHNIATIHGLEEADGAHALVMELVEGDDLAQRIARRPIPIDEALPIARQIAEALEAAHEQGIIHRDLKPANIKVRLDGTVKVLDFGMAKALDPAGPEAVSASQASTVTTAALMTGAGMILGTAAYMAPEQARGQNADKRADIWAFGVVLWEMLTGRRLFAGDTASDTLAAVLRQEPALDAVPQQLQGILRLCLQKDPRRRIRDIGDARVLLEDSTVSPMSPATTSKTARPRPIWRRAMPVVATAVATALLVGGSMISSTRRAGQDAASIVGVPMAPAPPSRS